MRAYFHVVLILLCAVYTSSNALGVSEHYKRKPKFIKELSELKASLQFDFTDATEEINLPISKIKQRLKKSKKDKRVEPIQILLKPKLKSIEQISRRLARPDKEDALKKLIYQKIPKALNHSRMKDRKVINFYAKDFKVVSPKKFSEYFGRTHHNVEIVSKTLRQNHEKLAEFSTQLAPYFTQEEMRKIKSRINKQSTISVDKHLLPPFARKLVKKYTVYRGPNCFHSAVAFNSTAIPYSKFLNVTKERDYHRAMINYDELWRILQTYFYEVKNGAPLKYGDVLVFFDIEEGNPISYRWIKHAAAYLFGPYTYSKGSKSANTPYTVKTLSEEWDTWKKYTKNMGVKVFRSSLRDPKASSPKDLLDWMY